jgi:hypothetical protein
MEAGEIDMEPHAVKVLSLLETEINVHHAMINTDFTVKQIIFPPPYFDSILTNLVSNSIMYSNTGISLHRCNQTTSYLVNKLNGAYGTLICRLKKLSVLWSA